MIVGDHFNKTSPGRLDLANIAQSGMAQWADSWILQKHRDAPNLDENKFWLEVETGTRRGGGKRLEVDWTLERDRRDPDVILWTGVDWDCRPSTATTTESRDSKTAQQIVQLLRDRPFELTVSALVGEVGGKREKVFDVLNQLKANGWVALETRPRQEGSRTVTRTLVGLGSAASRFGEVVPKPGTSSTAGNRFDQLVPEPGTSSERVADE